MFCTDYTNKLDVCPFFYHYMYLIDYLLHFRELTFEEVSPVIRLPE